MFGIFNKLKNITVSKDNQNQNNHLDGIDAPLCSNILSSSMNHINVPQKKTIWSNIKDTCQNIHMQHFNGPNLAVPSSLLKHHNTLNKLSQISVSGVTSITNKVSQLYDKYTETTDSDTSSENEYDNDYSSVTTLDTLGSVDTFDSMDSTDSVDSLETTDYNSQSIYAPDYNSHMNNHQSHYDSNCDIFSTCSKIDSFNLSLDEPHLVLVGDKYTVPPFRQMNALREEILDYNKMNTNFFAMCINPILNKSAFDIIKRVKKANMKGEFNHIYSKNISFEDIVSWILCDSEHNSKLLDKEMNSVFRQAKYQFNLMCNIGILQYTGGVTHLLTKYNNIRTEIINFIYMDDVNELFEYPATNSSATTPVVPTITVSDTHVVPDTHDTIVNSDDSDISNNEFEVIVNNDLLDVDINIDISEDDEINNTIIDHSNIPEVNNMGFQDFINFINTEQ